MLARFGNVLYWAATVIAVCIIGLVAYAVMFGDPNADRFGQGLFAFIGVVIWLLGRAFRYVLSGE